MSPQINVTVEDATNLLIEWMEKPDHGGFGSYGYDLYLELLVMAWFKKAGVGKGSQAEQHEIDKATHAAMPTFMAAAWELCRRGIVRPGVKDNKSQNTDEGSAGFGYSITPLGRLWLEEKDHGLFVPPEPGRFGVMLEPFKHRFGAGFHQRATEALRAFNGNAYLATVVMCGAAAESVILAAAIAKAGDEGTVMAKYKGKSGRKAVEDSLLGQAPKEVREQYQAHASLLKYWRDESAHGTVTKIDGNHAYTTLLQVIRLCHFIDDYWEVLTGKV